MARPLAILLVLLLAPASIAQPSSPNVVLILTDDQGWTSTSVQLDPANPASMSDFYQTARLAELAAQGMRFSNAYASAPVCSPSRAAIQTGKSPARLQMTDVVLGGDLASPEERYLLHYVGEPLSPPLPLTRLPLEEVTIAERIKQANPSYVTAHFGKWHLALSGDDEDAGLQGYDEHGWGPEVGGENPKKIDQLTNMVDGFLEDRAAGGEPFFLQISHRAVHSPIEARAATLAQYQALPGGVNHDASDADFAAMVHDLDVAIGDTIDKLAELGLDGDTYLFVVSDNGGRTAEGYGNNVPLVDGKGATYEGGIRVPMIVAGPGIAPGSHCDVPVITHDLFTTITALAGATAPLPEGVEGGDLCPILFNGGALPAGTDAIVRPHAPNGELLFHFPHYLRDGSADPWGITPTSVIRDGDLKLIKRYGAGGAPDQLLLFDLSQSLEETFDPASPLNLADDMPATAAAMEATLDAWLEAIDASHAYEVDQPVELTWRAGSPDPAGTWRSQEDVDYVFRERWEADPFAPPALVVAPTPPGLSDQAFAFDGGDRFIRKFFHVSDAALPDVIDADHSATFELWLQADALDQNQVLFESGNWLAGLSLTFGDGDGDGEFDEARFRILGSDGTHLTLTATLDPIITTAFVHLVAVFSDDPADRYAELFLEGVSIGRLDGVDGPDEIDWDGLDRAMLGFTFGFAIGGSGGFGPLPFSGGGFRGKIATFRFANEAWDAATVQARRDEIAAGCVWDCASADGQVDVEELLAVLAEWGGAGACDVDGSGVGVTDLLAVLSRWGPCP